MNSPPTLGRSILASSALQTPPLEAQHGHTETFEQVDRLLGCIISHTLAADERTLQVTEARRSTTISIAPIEDDQLIYVRDKWSVKRHEQAGFWNLSPSLSLRSGLANLPLYQRQQPAFFSTPAFRETAKIDSASSPEGIYYWTQLEPVLEHLFAPLRLRGPAITLKAEARTTSWTEYAALADALGISTAPVVTQLRSAARWVQMPRAEQVATKRAYVELLREQVTAESGSLLRAVALRPLIERYYAKAHDGRALRKAVLTKPLQRTLAGYFAGDWFAFLNYLGEQPHPDEQLVGALPQPKVVVATKAKAAEIAAATGVAPDQVGAIMAAYAGGQGDTSPAEQRIAALKRFWVEFDQLHANQKPGMPSLESIVGGRGSITFPVVDHGRYFPTPADAYRILSPDLIADVNDTWGTTMLPRVPDRIVSTTFPVDAATSAFGPALSVWHSLSMAAWRATEAMWDDSAGVVLSADDYDRYVEAQRGSFPIGRAVLDEMRAAVPRLGKPRPIDEPHVSKAAVAPGIEISITMSMSGGMARRDGFELLRDIVTRHRRQWAAKYLDAYLDQQLVTDLRQVADNYNRRSAERGKPPTTKQFAAMAEHATSSWFGGDLTLAYAAIGAKSPITTATRRLLPTDRIAFAWAVFTELGGDKAIPKQPEDDLQAYYGLERLAGDALRYVQLQEALDRPPTIAEFGRTPFIGRSQPALGKDVEEAWVRYQAAIERALRRSQTPSENEPRRTATPSLKDEHRGGTEKPSYRPSSHGLFGRIFRR